MNQHRKKILVTGGTGYIGSHTIVDLWQQGYFPISVDNEYNSEARVLESVQVITGMTTPHYKVDLCDFEATRKIFHDHPDIEGIIHFAALKAVGESVQYPLLYYKNNLVSLLNIIELANRYHVKAFIFSSSCTVYGEGQQSPIDETMPLMPASSPYGSTKQMSEHMLLDCTGTSGFKTVLLRYFNPAGAHPSGILGESPKNIALNLVPVITETAIGKREVMSVFGEDYDTRDGTCIRDYIHVCDLSRAHILALTRILDGKQNVPVDIFNLGIGEGLTVLEIIRAFEKVSGEKLHYKIGPRRPGDMAAIYAKIDKARDILGWYPAYGVEDIMRTAWVWEKNRSGGNLRKGNLNQK